MKETSLPTYVDLYQALNETTLKLHPSQVHGLICGILCGDPKGVLWETLVTGKQEPEAAHAVLKTVYEASAKQLADFLFELELLLPDDTEDLPARAEALTLWCQGFLTGLKQIQIPLSGRQPGETTEAINDLVEIAKMNYEDVVASEEDETAYIELVEYVRMAVILIYQDLRGDEASKQQPVSSKSHLH